MVNAELSRKTEIPGGGGRGRLYLSLHCHTTLHYTVTTRMTPALIWAAMRALNVRDKAARQSLQTTTSEAWTYVYRGPWFEERGREPKRSRTEVVLLCLSA